MPTDYEARHKTHRDAKRAEVAAALGVDPAHVRVSLSWGLFSVTLTDTATEALLAKLAPNPTEDDA